MPPTCRRTYPVRVDRHGVDVTGTSAARSEPFVYRSHPPGDRRAFVAPTAKGRDVLERVGELIPESRATSLPGSASSAPLLCATTSGASSSTQLPPEHSMTTYQRLRIGNRMDLPCLMRVGGQRAAPDPHRDAAVRAALARWLAGRGVPHLRRCHGCLRRRPGSREA